LNSCYALPVSRNGEHCEKAVALLREHKPEELAGGVDTLGRIARLTGQHAQALDYHRQALELIRAAGDRFEEPGILDRLGQSHAALGEHAAARTAWRQAIEIYQDQHRAEDARRIQTQLDGLT
jgi:tetratricopeptide (TPR) repeat protein